MLTPIAPATLLLVEPEGETLKLLVFDLKLIVAEAVYVLIFLTVTITIVL